VCFVVGENDMNLMRDVLIFGFGMQKLKFTYSYNCCEPYSACRQGEKEFLGGEGVLKLRPGGEKDEP
jgi:hypothetical protein